MTLTEAIGIIDTVKPNGYGEAEKIRWLSVLDGTVKRELLDTREGAECGFEGYSERTDRARELLVPHPYDEIYIRWLEAQIDYAGGEYGKYNNSIALFNAAYEAFEKYCNRTRTPTAKAFTNF